MKRKEDSNKIKRGHCKVNNVVVENKMTTCITKIIITEAYYNL